jgi:photosystem II stability/assembly factor-like uncharacterized protein
LRATLILLAALLADAGSAAGAPRWTQATPFGGALAALAAAPSEPRSVYAMAPSGQFFASRDGGETWEPRGNPFIYPPWAADLRVNVRDPETLYALAGGDLIRSRDGASDWEGIGPPAPGAVGFAADRDDPGLLFAATDTGLFRSRDGGGTWDLAAFQDLYVGCVAADPGHPATYFAVVFDSAPEAPPAVFKSSDRGETWARLASLPAGLSPPIPPFVFDPSRPDTVYLAGGSSYAPLLRSDDGGVTWAALADRWLIRDLAVTADGALVAATARLGVSRSTDRGATWSPPLQSEPRSAPADFLQRIVAVSEPEGETILAVGGEGFWKSNDSGVRWHESSRGILIPIDSIAVLPADPPEVLATGGQEVFRSLDQGATWQRLRAYYELDNPRIIAEVDPRQPQTLYGIASGGGDVDYLVTSTDGGVTWREMPFPFTHVCGGSLCYVTMRALVLDPGEHDTFYTAGDHWLYHYSGPGPFLLRSRAGSEKWDDLPTLPVFWSLFVVPGRQSPLIASTRERLYKKDKSGGPWLRTGRGLPSLHGGAALAADPRDPERIYAGTAQGVFVSDDQGGTFRPMNRGLETAKIWTILIDPLNPVRLFVAADKGSFRWHPGLRKWTPFNDGLPSPASTGVLALDPRHTSRLYTATDQGIYRIDLDGEGAPEPQPEP